MAKLKIKKGDTVQVITGSAEDRNKKGAVLAIDSKKMLIKVQGIKMQTNYTQEGLQKLEGFIDYSNVKLVDAAKKAADKKKKATASK